MSRRYMPFKWNRLSYAVVAALAFMLGGAGVAVGGPVVSGFVGLIDGNNTAAINATGELSVVDSGTRAALAKLTPQQPFTADLANCDPCTAPNATVSFRVPAGKRAVVEFVTAFAFGGEGPIGVTFGISGNTAGSYAGFDLGTVLGTPTSDSMSIFEVHQLIRTYADPGTVIQISAGRSTGGFDHFRAQISGYYVNVP